MSIFLPLIKDSLYWGSIALSYIALLYVEARGLFIYKPPTLSEKEHEKGRPINFMCIAQTIHPLPQYCHVFSGVALNQAFIGWFIKMGKTFGGFISSMHQLGINAIFYIELNCKSDRYFLRNKIALKLTKVSLNMQRMMNLIILLLLYTKL